MLNVLDEFKMRAAIATKASGLFFATLRTASKPLQPRPARNRE